MWITYIIAGIISIIDRAGIPVAMVGGLIAAHLNDWNVWPLVAVCIVAGISGDMTCFFIGKYIGTTKPRNQFERQGWRIRVQVLAEFIRPAPRIWLLCGRIFPAINQFIPMGAAILGYGTWSVLLYCSIGNVLWFGAFGFLSAEYIDEVAGSENMWQRVFVISGLVLCYCSWRLNKWMEHQVSSEKSDELVEP